MYLNIPYCDKKIAKKYGAIWDKKEKKWYCEETNELCNLYSVYKEIELIGEDRSFGSNELFIDMIPKTSYFKNVRTLFKKEDWNLIRHHIYKRTDNRCECCGCKRSKYLDAHERWSYDFETGIQKLERIIALCKLCHSATHYGHSKIMKNNINNINEHLKKIKNINDDELDSHIKEARNIWKERNKIQWKLDFSIITNSGFTILSL